MLNLAKRGPKGPSRYTPAFIEAQAEALLYYAEKAKLPLIKEYASTQRIPAQELSNFANPKDSNYNQKFAEALKRFKDIQEYKWCLATASGDVQQAFGIFLLKNVSEMRDEQHIKGEGIAPVFQIIVPQNATKNRLSEAGAV